MIKTAKPDIRGRFLSVIVKLKELMMSDWTKQTEQFISSWADTQKKMWDSWAQAMQASAAETVNKTFEAERQKAVEAWESSMKKGLEAQGEWAKLWVNSLSENKATPKPMLEWAKQMQEMMTRWTASQEELSHVWFNMIKTMDAGQSVAVWEKQGKKLLVSWQEAADKALEAQREMSKFWTKKA